MGKDAKATLKAVADAGYQNIEAAGYDNGKFYGMSPQNFKTLLSELNLNPISSHNSSVTLENAKAHVVLKVIRELHWMRMKKLFLRRFILKLKNT